MSDKRRVVAYARVSTDSEDQKNSYDNQKRYFERIIKANEAYEFLGIYADRGLSGTKLYRPEFDRLLRDAGLKRVVDEETGKPVDAYVIVGKPTIDLIYVKDITRFARNVSADALLKTLAINKVYVVYVTIDGVEHSTETVDGIPFMQGALQAAEQFSRDISSKVKFGMKEGAFYGNIFVGKQLYGYNYLPHPENRLVVVEEESDTVRLIFNLYVNEGYGTERIAKAESIYRRSYFQSNGYARKWLFN
jgi:site-specific DNA recombinase